MGPPPVDDATDDATLSRPSSLSLVTVVGIEKPGAAPDPLPRTAPVIRDLSPPAAVLRLTRHVKMIAPVKPTAADAVSARGKRTRKAVDMVVHNDAAIPGAAFEGDENIITIIGPGDAEHALHRMSKRRCAEAILDAAMPLVGGQRAVTA